MIIISEKHIGNEIYFTITISSDGESICNEIRFRSVTLSKNGMNYYVIYNLQMQICSDAFGFINLFLSQHAENTRIKAQQALKFLFSFEEIIGKALKDFSPTDFTNFKYFLHGYSPKGQTTQLQLLTIRSNQTVNSYLSIYRQYLSYLGIETSYLQRKSTHAVSIKIDDAFPAMKVERYKANEKTSHDPNLEVPMYISVNDFSKIIKLVREKYSIRDEIIIRLMFQCGLRIGEVLGLTAEDVVMEKIDQNYAPILYIRNRLTDSIDQNAKTCMKVYNAKQYRVSDYNILNYGYQYVVIPQDLFDLIDKYIEEFHNMARESSAKNRYFSKSIADSVKYVDSGTENYYIFLNTIGSPLHSHSWNEVLRSIFTELDIPLDKEKRKHNLNHRFRHGFAMFNVQHLNCKEVELADRMRHKSILSVYKYYRPTVSDQIKLKTDFANSLYEMIPELRR